jgi:hypothetical protein
MPTDPFVADRLDDEPRQLPNLSPGVTYPPARSWRADRPGDLVDGVQPRGAMLGSPGPNVGYALLLTRRAAESFERSPLEHGDDVEAVVAALAMKRAASFGRAPVAQDVESAALVLGYLGTPSSEFVELRSEAVDDAHHDYEAVRTIVDAVPLVVLRLAPRALGSRVAEVQDALLATADD